MVDHSRNNPYRNGRSSSFSVGLPRSACAIISIMSVFMTKIPIKVFPSHITTDITTRRTRPKAIISTGNRMAHEIEHVSSSQSLSGQCGPTSASYASPDQSNSLPRRPTTVLTNQFHDIDK